MDPKRIKELCGELPELLVSGYHPGELFFNKYSADEPTRAGCRYSDKGVAEGGALEEFVLLVEMLKRDCKLEEYESEKLFGETVFYGYVPDFPVVKNFIVEGECNFLSWKKGLKVYTLVNLTKEKQEPGDLSELPGLRTYEDSKEDDVLKKIFNIVKFVGKPLQSPFLAYAGYLPSDVDGWDLVTVFVFTQAISYDSKVFIAPRAQGNYRCEDEYLNIKLGFELSFFPKELTVVQTAGMKKTIMHGRDMYATDTSLLYYDTAERYSIEVSGDGKRKNLMKDFMSTALGGLEEYSNIEKTAEFAKEVNDIYGDFYGTESF